MKNVAPADSRTFQATVESNILVFVDFYADWCGPCKLIAPAIDKLADEYHSMVKFVRLDIDRNPDVAQRYGIKSIPTLIIFRNGKPFKRMVGASPIGHYRGELQKVISKMRFERPDNSVVNP